MDEVVIFRMMACGNPLQQGLKSSMELPNGLIFIFGKVIQSGEEHIRVFFDTPSFEKGLFKSIHGFDASIGKAQVPTPWGIIESSGEQLYD